MQENGVLRRVWLRMGGLSTLFRVNSGKAWATSGGKPLHTTINGVPGVFLPYGRPIALGFSLANGDPLVGASDLCGWTPIVVTPQMAGMTLPVFTAFEVKESAGGKKRDEQQGFVGAIQAAGGLAAFVDSDAAAIAAYETFVGNFPTPLDEQRQQ